jgi:hypothetical protein
MAQGQNTAGHPGRKVHRERFVPDLRDEPGYRLTEHGEGHTWHENAVGSRLLQNRMGSYIVVGPKGKSQH